MRTFVTQVSEAMGCDVAMVALPVLVTIASCIGTTRRIRLKESWSEPCILWAAIVARSGTLKSPPLRLAVRPLQEFQATEFKRFEMEMEAHEVAEMAYESDTRQWAKLKPHERGEAPRKPQEPRCIRHMTNDTTSEALLSILAENPRGVLVYRDELGGWFAGFDRYSGKVQGGDVTTWLQLFHGEHITLDRKTGTRRTYVPLGAASILGTIQPRILRRHLWNEHMDNGLAARLLFFLAPETIKIWHETDTSPEAYANYAGLLEDLLSLSHDFDANGDPHPQLVGLSDEAKDIWVPFYDEHGQRQASAPSEEIAAAFAKLEAYAARFALLFYLVRWITGQTQSEEIDHQCMADAITLTHWFINETQRAYACLSGEGNQETVDELQKYIAGRPDGATVRELMRSNLGFKEAQDAERALEPYVSSGRFQRVSRQNPKGGQPEIRYVARPGF